MEITPTEDEDNQKQHEFNNIIHFLMLICYWCNGILTAVIENREKGNSYERYISKAFYSS